MNILQNEANLDGLGQLAALMAANVRPPIGETLDFALVALERGLVVFEGSPTRKVFNPIGSVHGGYAATLLDQCLRLCGAFMPRGRARLYDPRTQGVVPSRALSETSGPVRAEGKLITLGRRVALSEAKLTDASGRLCASATSTLLIFPLDRSAKDA